MGALLLNDFLGLHFYLTLRKVNVLIVGCLGLLEVLSLASLLTLPHRLLVRQLGHSKVLIGLDGVEERVTNVLVVPERRHLTLLQICRRIRCLPRSHVVLGSQLFCHHLVEVVFPFHVVLEG